MEIIVVFNVWLNRNIMPDSHSKTTSSSIVARTDGVRNITDQAKITVTLVRTVDCAVVWSTK